MSVKLVSKKNQRSGVNIQPPKNPLVNLANISSSLMLARRSRLEIRRLNLSCSVGYFFGLSSVNAKDSSCPGVAEYVKLYLRDGFVKL